MVAPKALGILGVFSREATKPAQAPQSGVAAVVRPSRGGFDGATVGAVNVMTGDVSQSDPWFLEAADAIFAWMEKVTSFSREELSFDELADRLKRQLEQLSPEAISRMIEQRRAELAELGQPQAGPA